MDREPCLICGVVHIGSCDPESDEHWAYQEGHPAFFDRPEVDDHWNDEFREWEDDDVPF